MAGVGVSLEAQEVGVQPSKGSGVRTEPSKEGEECQIQDEWPGGPASDSPLGQLTMASGHRVPSSRLLIRGGGS